MTVRPIRARFGFSRATEKAGGLSELRAREAREGEFRTAGRPAEDGARSDGHTPPPRPISNKNH
ncbi:hypothetical protein [Pseudohongiella spirulinae]|uniref:hypothetical protein n=1 Tax=Pseudohongiella spirulinae TaxID=1249552 RepID=UPI0012E3CD24|nr:hypothetical protein [Pseudohongiella spirulinae]